ncbi:hypothetical protein ACIHJG_39195 [Streptomyces sp. NPDC052415]|uniref:hypothetical protein n=1 Tax=Streptomyces sp. NPDC052415 TaxID=3365690 RepID=UPI0037CEAFE0
MTVGSLLAALLGAARPDKPMARLLVRDEEALAHRVRLSYPAAASAPSTPGQA